jgi:hypothetical protein
MLGEVGPDSREDFMSPGMPETLAALLKSIHRKQSDDITLFRAFSAQAHLIPHLELPFRLNPRQVLLKTFDTVYEFIHRDAPRPQLGRRSLENDFPS